MAPCICNQFPELTDAKYTETQCVFTLPIKGKLQLFPSIISISIRKYADIKPAVYGIDKSSVVNAAVIAQVMAAILEFITPKRLGGQTSSMRPFCRPHLWNDRVPPHGNIEDDGCIGRYIRHHFVFEVNRGELFAFAGLWETWNDPNGRR